MKEVWIEVFKTGIHTDSSGDTHEWTLAELKSIEQTYNERITKEPSSIAPVVKGHPETDDPAYGWVDKLQVKGDVLLAKLKDLNPEFINEVKQKMYQKVSIALYPDLMLRHIGFLGAVQPAVKGLEPVKFNDRVYTMDFTECIEIVETKIETETQKDEVSENGINNDKCSVIDAKHKMQKINTQNNTLTNTQNNFANNENITTYEDEKIATNTQNNTQNNKQITQTKKSKEINNIYNNIYKEKKEKENIIKEKEKKENAFKDNNENNKNLTISAKNKLFRKKPIRYSHYNDSDFADSVNYRFPLRTKNDVLVSMRLFGRIKKYYTAAEKQDIVAKIIVAAKKHGVNRDFAKWIYNENKYNFKGINMNDELFNSFLEALYSWVLETINEETVALLQSFVDDWKSENINTSEKSIEEAEPSAKESELLKQYSEKLKDYEKKIEILEIKSRIAEFSENLSKKTNLTPALRSKLLPLMEIAHQYDRIAKEVKFSEDGKERKIPASVLILELIDKIPDEKLFNEFATKENAPANNEAPLWQGVNVNIERLDLHNKILQKQKEFEAKGEMISYEKALTLIGKEVK